MPQRWNQEQMNRIAEFFFEHHEDFGGDKPWFTYLDVGDLVNEINRLGPKRSAGSLVGKLENIRKVHLQKKGEGISGQFSKLDVATYETTLRQFKTSTTK
mgnify:CR=1 FL=1